MSAAPIRKLSGEANQAYTAIVRFLESSRVPAVLAPGDHPILIGPENLKLDRRGRTCALYRRLAVSPATSAGWNEGCLKRFSLRIAATGARRPRRTSGHVGRGCVRKNEVSAHYNKTANMNKGIL